MPDQAAGDVLFQPARRLRSASGSRLQAQWLAVVVPDDGDPFVITFDSFDLLAEHIRGQIGADVSIFPLYGVRVAITQGEQKWLIHPNGSPVPLFRTGCSTELDDSGFLGKKVAYQDPPDLDAVDMFAVADADDDALDADDSDSDYESDDLDDPDDSDEDPWSATT